MVIGLEIDTKLQSGLYAVLDISAYIAYNVYKWDNICADSSLDQQWILRMIQIVRGKDASIYLQVNFYFPSISEKCGT